MPYTDKNGRVWPDTMVSQGVNLILDPVASMAAKRPKYRPDPRERKEYGEKYGFIEKPEEPASALEGLAMTGAGAATMIGGQKLGGYIADQFGQKVAEQGLSEVGKSVLGSGANAGASQASNLASLDSFGQIPAFSLDTGTGAASGVAGEAASTAAATDGGSLLTTAAPYLGLAGAGLGAYGIKQAIDARDTKSGALSGAGMGLGLGAAAPLLGFGPLGWGALGLMALGGGGVGAGLTAALGHESTKDTQKRRWGGLSEAAQGLYQANHPDGDTGVWDTGKYAGQSWTFDKALDLAKEDPTHFQGVYGNMAAVGSDKYLGLDDAKQKEFVRRNIAAGNYDSKKGDVIIKDKTLANKILAEIEQPAASLAQAGANAIQRPVVSNQQAFRR